MNTILEDQNKEASIRLLRAQNSVYTKAKDYQIIDVISIIIALTPTILILFNLKPSPILTVVGVVWTIISIFSQIFIENDTKLGARIQDQFDTTLFKIPKNSILVGKDVDLSRILELSKPNKNENLKDWYSTKIIPKLEHKMAVILAYKCNTVWGKSQRREFVNFITVMILVYYGLMILLSMFKNTGLFDFIEWLSPSIPALVYCISTIKAQNSIIKTYDRINTIVDNFHKDYIKDNNTLPSETELRQIQDLFFTQRLIPNKVPDWFYNLFKKKTSEIVDDTIDIMINEINL